MKTWLSLSPTRVWAVFLKEFQQMLRDRLTFAMAVGVPVLQLILFGYAINTDPRQLPTALVSHDTGPMARSLSAALQNTGYFRIVHTPASEQDGDALIATGQAQFLIVIPPDFTRRIVRGEQPAVLVSVDATDPSAAANAVAALGPVGQQALSADLQGVLAPPQPATLPFEWRVHRRYNPEGLSRYNIVPGLIGKIVPYVLIGYVQFGVILLTAHLLFAVPMAGSYLLLILMIGGFMLANLAVGFTFSTLAQNQLQALQMTFFFFLPSLLLSGFMFPFRGMPDWAQSLGELLPLTHFLRIVRGIMLKGNGMTELLPELWPLLGFTVVAAVLALIRYRRTLD